MNNPMQMMQALMQNIISANQRTNNPMMQNAIGMLQKGDVNGLEQMAKNLCQTRNINYDEEIKKFKGRFGIK